ncbi:TPA: EexN family lipoprotein [Vibrio parahaemolyticus]
MKKLIFLSLATVLLAACNAEETKTIEYYSKHLDEAKTLIAECNKKTATRTENCKNAQEAVSNDKYEKFMHGDGIPVGE